MHHLPKAMQYRQAPLAIFWVIFKNTKLGMGRVSQVRSLTPNFTVVALKCGLTGVKIAKIANFWYNFAKKGYTRFFPKFGLGERVPCPHPPAKFHRCGF